MKRMIRCAVAMGVVALSSTWILPLEAAYGRHCAELAHQLAVDPESLGLAELEQIEACTRALRAGASAETIDSGQFCEQHCPPEGVEQVCPPPEPPPDLAEVCPSFMKDKRRRERGDRPLVRPHLPGRE